MATKPREKMFVEILNKLKGIIQKDGLQPGDKLPSERELSERLNVGRSSVREALRAMELLGLIETRRGEGTFIKEARNHRLVQVLASFILNDGLVKQELTETRQMIEKNAIMLASNRRSKTHVQLLQAHMRQIEDAYQTSDQIDKQIVREFFSTILDAAQNSLLKRLWVELTQYDQFHEEFEGYSKRELEQIVQLIETGPNCEDHLTFNRFIETFK